MMPDTVWLVLCAPADRPALWVACELRRCGLLQAEVVSGDAVVLAPVWEHRIGTDGTATSTIRLSDGRVIHHSAVRGVLNRLGNVPAPSVCVNEREAAYIQEERTALLLSWLASLPNVINRPTPQGLAGAWHSRAQSQWLAAAAGLPVFSDRYRSPHETQRAWTASLPRSSVIVLDGQTFGPRVPAPLEEACVAYARLAQTRLVGLEFIHDQGRWTFNAATPMPNLAAGGAALLQALAAALRDA
jgi:hypothetical protein